MRCNNYYNNPVNVNLSFFKRLLLFICVTVLCFMISGFISGVLIYLKGGTAAVLRISAVIQDVVAFIMPALITAVLITRLPAKFLLIDCKPKINLLVIACLVLIISIPTMNTLVEWNESITLPDSMAEIEKAMREAETKAQEAVSVMLGGKGAGALIISVLIVGVLAGLSEEIFFRGAFQRLISTAGANHHFAIWLTAFVFSAMHMQFYGFFGRLLLGAYFGYLLYWTGSLWIPVICHILNNTLYIIGNYLVNNAYVSPDVNTLGSDSLVLCVISVCGVVAGIYFLKRIAVTGSLSADVKG